MSELILRCQNVRCGHLMCLHDIAKGKFRWKYANGKVCQCHLGGNNGQ